MTSTVERRIVQMVFEADRFRRGIRQSIDDLSALKKSFQFDQAQKSLSELEKASHVDFNPMAQSLDAINGKLSILGVAAAEVVSRVTGAIIDTGQKLLGAVLLDPITTGLEEYETQLNAVQTILANTAKEGTTLSIVTDALDELNRYADLTIYNFTQMTDNIGKFTAAGVGLDDSVLAIKGIANLAAVSGSNSQQASVAMYQLSQAISTGSLKLQDWNSVVNAGMGGQLFQDALADTARAHGVAVDTMIANNGSFRASLQEGWISSEILLETLAKLTGDLSDAELEAMGYTKEQIAEIQKQAQVAVDAATKIKTLTQLLDTLKESLQSGWSETWRYIFGDFEQAKELWGRVAEFFSGFIEKSADARNEMFRTWNEVGARDLAIEGLFNVLDAVANIMRHVGAAFRYIFGSFDTKDLLNLTLAFYRWTQGLKEGTDRLWKFRRIMLGIFAVFDIVRLFVVALAEVIGALIPDLSGVRGGFIDWLVEIANSILKFRQMAKETGLFKTVILNVIEQIKVFIGKTKELIQKFLDLEVINKVVEWIKGLEREDFVNLWQGFLKVLEGIAYGFGAVAYGAQWLYKEFVKLEVVQEVLQWFKEIDFSEISNEFVKMGDDVKAFIDELKEGENVQKFLAYLNTFDGRRFKAFQQDAKDWWAGLGESSEKIKTSLDGLSPFFESVKTEFNRIKDIIGETFGDIFDYLAGKADKIDYSRLFDIINAGLIGGIIIAINNLSKMFNLDNILGDSDFGDALVENLESISGALDSFALSVKADALKNVALAIVFLAGAIWLLTLLDEERVASATAIIIGLGAGLAIAARKISGIDLKGAAAGAIAMIGIGLALVIVGGALVEISSIDPEKIDKSIAAVAAALITMVTAVLAINRLAGSEAKVLAIVAIMFGLSKSLGSLGNAIATLGAMDEETLVKGGAAVASIMTAITLLAIAMSKWGSKDAQKVGVSVLAMAGAILIISFAVERLGDLSWQELAKGLIGISVILLGMSLFASKVPTKGLLEAAVSIAIIAGAMYAMYYAIKQMATLSIDEYLMGIGAIGFALLIIVGILKLASGPMVLSGAAAIGIVSLAILVLAHAMQVISSLTWDQIKKAGIVIGGFFAILVIAGYLLAPVVPVLLGLGVAIGLIGLAALGFGLGVFLASAGLVALAGSAILIAEAIRIVSDAIIEVLPGLAVAFADAIVAFIGALAEKGPELMEAFQGLIINMLNVITSPDFLPNIVGAVLGFVTALLEQIALKLPDLLQAGYDILIAILDGIGDNIKDVVTKGLAIITELIAGLEEGLPDLAVQATKTLITFLETIESDIITPENVSRMVSIGMQIAANIASGVLQGLIDGAGAIIDTFGDTIDNIFRKGEEVEEAGSPSRRAIRLAGYIMEGLVIGLKSNMSKVERAMADFGKAIKTNLEPIVQGMAEDIEKEFLFEPVIAPVLDLDKFSSGARGLDNFFNNRAVLAELSTNVGRPIAEEADSSKTQSAQGGVTFNQYNYSPKALDRETIYRQTRTQVARLELERAFG